MASQKDWLKIFAPTAINELAVHPKKIQEVEQWLLAASTSRSNTRLLVLTGPPGSGKTAVVRVLAKVHRFYIQEWMNTSERMLRSVDDDDEWQSEEYSLSQTAAFRNFLFKSSRYVSVMKPQNKRRLILIEDLPNAISKDVNSFQKILEEYGTYCTKCPLILIISDGKDMLDYQYQLVERLKVQSDKCTHITFNAIASTLMQKAMKSFVAQLKGSEIASQTMYTMPSETIQNSIIVSAHGDIRNALINLHFACLKDAPNLEITPSVDKSLISSKLKRPAKNTKKRQSYALKTVGTTEYISLPHALGRVFNPKFDECHKLIHQPEEIIALFQSEPKRFITLLHANYQQHYSEIWSFAEAANYFSLCGKLIDAYYDAESILLGFDVIVRSLMVSNKKPSSGWKPLLGCRKDKPMDTMKNATLSAQEHRVTLRQYLMDYKPLVTIIQRKVTQTQRL